MSQHDYVIDNASGAVVRADINSVLQAILSGNSGTSAPSTTVAGMWWMDTTGGAPYTLKIRDAGNNHWLTVASITDPGSDGDADLVGSSPIKWVQTAIVTSTGASSASSTFIDTGLEITISSANAALCSKIILSIGWGIWTSEGSSNKNAAWQILRDIGGSTSAYKISDFGEDGPEMAPTSKSPLGTTFADTSLGSGDRDYKLQYKTTSGSTSGYLGESSSINTIVAYGIT